MAAVLDIESQGLRAKAVGSNMSFSAAARSDHCLIETFQLDKHLSRPFDTGTAPWPASRFRDGIGTDCLSPMIVPELRKRMPRLIYIEGGMKIRDLLADLAATGLALPAMGAGGAQSVAGALATGTHGAEMDRQPMIDAIRAVHLVGPGGQEWWIERTNGLSDPARLPTTVPDWCVDTQIVQDDRVFYSAIVSAGRLGVVYALILEVEEQYWLEERRTKEPWAPVRALLTESATNGFESPTGVMQARGVPGVMYLGIVLNVNSSAQCWVMERRIHHGAKVEIGTQKTTSLATHAFCAPMPVATLAPLLAALTPIILLIPVVGPALLPVVTTALTALFLTPFVSLGEIISTVLRLVPSASGALIDFALDEHDGKPPIKVGPSQNVLDQMFYDAPADCYQGDQFEFFFDARSTRYLEFVDLVTGTAAALGGVPGYINIRFMQHSDAAIGMEQYPMTAAVEVVVQRGSGNGMALLGSASVTGVALGGIPHWGKGLFVAPRSTTPLPTGSVEQFQYTIALVEEGHPATFSSQFTRDSGLELPPGVSLPELDRRTSRQDVSLARLLDAAAARLSLPSSPASLLAVASKFPPSLRMNAGARPLPRGRAAVDGPEVRLRDLASRIL